MPNTATTTNADETRASGITTSRALIRSRNSSHADIPANTAPAENTMRNTTGYASVAEVRASSAGPIAMYAIAAGQNARRPA